MNEFALWKKNFLAKKDKSKKGSVDPPIVPLLTALNACPSYFTTSSCSGRITLWVEPRSGKKNDVEFLFESHCVVDVQQMLFYLPTIPRERVWLRFEPMILHVACRTLDDAHTLLDVMRRYYKHSGILSAKRRIIVEIRGSEFIEAPVACARKFIAPPDYLAVLICMANQKLRRTHHSLRKVTALVTRRC